MASGTQRQPEEEIHGEEITRPRFGPGSEKAGTAEKPSSPKNDNSSDNSSRASSRIEIPGYGSVASPETLKAAEESSALGSLGKGFNPLDSFKGGALQRVLGLLSRHKKKTAGGVVAGGVLGGGMIIFSIVQGPLQFIHMAQLFQRFHLNRNEDLGDYRSWRVLLYTLGGHAEQARLGNRLNKKVDKYEARLERAGLKPAYDRATGRFVGFVTDDTDIAEALRRQTGNGVEIKKVGDENGNIKGSKNNPDLNSGSTFVDARGCDRGGIDGFKCHRNMIREVGRATGTSKTISAINSRLLIKRGGVSFHILNKLKKKAEESDSDFIKKILRRNAEDTRKGSKQSGATVAQRDADGDGNPDPNPETDGLEDEVKEAAEQGLSDVDEAAGLEDSTKAIYRNALVKAGGGTALVVGVLCAASDFGDNVEDYKYTNNVLPMMRMGWKVVAMGNQAMSGDDLNMEELGAYSELLYDKKAKPNEQSWTNAKTIQAELGKNPTGPDLPHEARLKNINDKPAFFDILNSIPGFNQACDVGDFISNLPVIKEVSILASDAAIASADLVLASFGTNVEELSGRALALVAGDTINPYAKGAEFGNLANTGAFLAANDQAISNGGRALNNQEVAQLKEDQRESEIIENSQKSFAKRYFDAYDGSSLLGSLVTKLPLSFSDSLVALPSKFANFSWGTFSSWLTPVLGAEQRTLTSEELYGIAEYGFSLDEQSDERFENPFRNARWIERGDRLERLSDKYGGCFGMKISESGSGIDLSSENAVNVFKLKDKPECNGNSTEFLRFRFYLVDAVTAISLACLEDDEEACSMLGVEAQQSPGDNPTADSGGAVNGTIQELAQQLLDLADRGKIDIDNYYSEDPASDSADRSTPRKQLEDLANGNSAKGSTRCGHDNAEINPDIKILQFLVDLGGQTNYTINSLFGQCHSPTSLHYQGKAVDFSCSLNIGVADRVGQNYGVQRNFEACPGHGHWHYSVGGG